jgi:hypothetical protein
VLGETCFSGAALALLAVVLAPVMTAVGILYRDSLKSRDLQIADLSLRLTGMQQEASDRFREGAAVMDAAQSELKARTPPGRRR